jgi:putative phosphoribosyl transferase
MPFADRRSAGRRLGAEVARLGLTRPLVLALPRGGVPVAYEVATALRSPLDVFVARKLGAPGHPELGVGAIAEGSDAVVVSDTARMLGLGEARVHEIAARERPELDRRVERYRAGGPPPAVAGRHVVLVDDGLATGVTAEAALRALRAAGTERLVLAVPVCAPDTAQRLAGLADDVLCVESPPSFGAVGTWYEDFRQTSDEEVVDLLARARAAVAPDPGG